MRKAAVAPSSRRIKPGPETLLDMTITQTLRTLLCLLALTTGLTPARAHIIEPLRAQIVLLPLPQTPARNAEATPTEISLKAGDLISIFASTKAQLKFYEKDPADRTPTLQALDETLYTELSRQGGGQVAQHGMPAVRGHAWQRFGAARAGVVHLRVREGRDVVWYRLAIESAPEYKRGRDIRYTEADQGRTLLLTLFDQLVLELPGEVGEGWSATPPPASGLRLNAISEAPGSRPEARRVLLRFSVVGAELTGPEQRLEVSTGPGTEPRRTFHFIWRRAAVPLGS